MNERLEQPQPENRPGPETDPELPLAAEDPLEVEVSQISDDPEQRIIEAQSTVVEAIKAPERLSYKELQRARDQAWEQSKIDAHERKQAAQEAWSQERDDPKSKGGCSTKCCI